MELRLVNGMVLKVQLEEMAGGVGERVAALETKLREQGDAMAALKRRRRTRMHVELALAALKDGRAEKNLDERKEASAGEHARAERREKKRRKRDDAEAGKEVEMADSPSVVRPLIALGGAPEGKGDAAEREGDELEEENDEEEEL
ncbi:unnamed protein product [Closterium sp. NIES-65]|nr:unnamed protein product [Closterium sp. NIES-65]